MATVIFELECRTCGDAFTSATHVSLFCSSCQAQRDWEDMCRYGFE